MIANEQNEKKRRVHPAALVAIAVCTALGLSAAARAETHFVPRLGVDATWVDNVNLAPPGAAKDSELIWQARPGLMFTHYSDRVQAFADYTFQAVHFTEDSHTETYNQAQIGLLGEILRDWFYVDLGGTQSQASADPTQRTNVGNLFQVGNIADVRTWYATPILHHSFKWAELTATYTRARVDYAEANDLTTLNIQDDSKSNTTAISLNSVDRESTLTWATHYTREDVNYDVGLPYRNDRLTAEAGYRVTAPLRLLVQGGLESDPRIRSDDGGLDESSWAAGFDLRSGLRMELRALAGHRFFGNSYEFLWRYTGRALEASVTYTEAATTDSQTRVLTGVAPPGGFPAQIDPTFDRLTNDVYISKALGGRFGLRGRLTEIYFAVTAEEREYVGTLAGLTDKFKGASVQLTRRLGPRLNLLASGGYTKSNLREGTDYTEALYNVTLARQLGTRTALTLSGNRVDRSGSQGYDANWVVLGFTMNFGAPGEVGAQGGGYRGPSGGARGSQPARPTLPTGPRLP
jgi:hypothetical protein